jgi:hypothetical protein
MNRHSPKQRLIVLTYFNDKVLDPFIDMEISYLRKSHDLSFHKYLDNLPKYEGSKTFARELLYMYCLEQSLLHGNILAAFAGFSNPYQRVEEYVEVYKTLLTLIEKLGIHESKEQ